MVTTRNYKRALLMSVRQSFGGADPTGPMSCLGPQFAYQQSLTNDPCDARECKMRAAQSHRSGRTREAVEWLRRAVELEPASAILRSNLAAAMGMLGRHGDAARELAVAIRLAPNSAEACNNLGVALEHLEQYPDAVKNLRKAVCLEDGDARAWANLSNALRKSWQPSEALEAAERAAALDARYAEAHNNAGAALLELGQLDKAAQAFARAIEVMPGHAEARVNGAMVLLSQGDWVSGFRAFECRFEHTAWRRKLPGRRWAAPAVGSIQRAAAPPPRGSTVLLYGEGGLGNAIQFARFASRVAEMGLQVVIECRSELAPLLRTVPGVSKVIGIGDSLPPYDCYAALMSLPALLGVNQSNAALTGPYLAAQSDRVTKWGQYLRRLAAAAPKQLRPLLVGVSWQGEQTPLFRCNRSFPAGQLAKLARLPGVRLVSLQKGCTFDGSFPLVELPELDAQGGAFLDTAAVMTHLDLIITCDTSIAHVAGALARPTWVALPFAADWRWMRDRDDTPWYPTMRLFRQESPGDWDRVFGQIVKALLEDPADQSRRYSRGPAV